VERDSFPAGASLVLGILLIILAGFDDGIPPSSELERYMPYLLLIAGVSLIVVAIALMRRNR
jgi:cytochrome c biogenesis protein CcdA